jgi:MutS domain V
MDSTLSEPPLREYVSRRNRWQAERQILERQFIRIGNWRLTLGIAGALLAWLAFGPHLVTAWVLLVLLIAFVALVIWHQRVLRRRTLAGRAIAYYERGLARLDDRWIDTGSRGEQFRDASHVYAEDLDVLGKGSLFELIASARTSAGEQTLARWLLSPADREEALSRQEAVRELRARLDLREELALLGEDIHAEVHLEALEKWGFAAPVGFARGLRALALVLALGGAVTLLAFFAQALPLWPFAVILGCDFVLIWNLRSQVTHVRAAIDAPAQGLRILSLLLERLEKEAFEAPRLKELRAALDVKGLPASKRIARLERWIDWLDSGEHLFVRVIRPIVLWYEQLAMGIEAWRRENGSLVGQWLRAVAEFEALSSLASIAFERPHWAFPLLVEGIEPHLEAQDLQHPLMSPAKCMPNDISFSGDLRLFIVSGSNMSGKSTLLRSMGLNCVLAWAGGPVAAKRMRVSRLQPAASIRVVDSLHDNRSRFFAEISRIRQIVDLTQGNRTVLFLLDELLSGTNSHDRRIGAAGIVRKLVASGAIGLITTHDLALAEIEQDLGTAATNVHFDDQIVDGQIAFDYKLRPGIVTHSNALELMRAVGLEI